MKTKTLSLILIVIAVVLVLTAIASMIAAILTREPSLIVFTIVIGAVSCSLFIINELKTVKQEEKHVHDFIARSRGINPDVIHID